jgi:hypothetical protein
LLGVRDRLKKISSLKDRIADLVFHGVLQTLDSSLRFKARDLSIKEFPQDRSPRGITLLPLTAAGVIWLFGVVSSRDQCLDLC